MDIFQRTSSGARRVGRPALRFMDACRRIKSAQMSIESWESAAADSNNWRQTVQSDMRKAEERINKLWTEKRERRRDYHRLPSTTVDYHRLPSTTIDYHRLPPTTIDYHRLPSTTIDYHRLPSTTIDYHRLPPTTTDYHRLPSTTIDYHRLPSTSIDYHRLPPTTTPLHQTVYTCTICSRHCHSKFELFSHSRCCAKRMPMTVGNTL